VADNAPYKAKAAGSIDLTTNLRTLRDHAFHLGQELDFPSEVLSPNDREQPLDKERALVELARNDEIEALLELGEKIESERTRGGKNSQRRARRAVGHGGGHGENSSRS